MDIANSVRTLQQVVHAAAGTPDERTDAVEGTGLNKAITWADVMAFANGVEPPVIDHDPDEGRGKKRRLN